MNQTIYPMENGESADRWLVRVLGEIISNKSPYRKYFETKQVFDQYQEITGCKREVLYTLPILNTHWGKPFVHFLLDYSEFEVLAGFFRIGGKMLNTLDVPFTPKTNKTVANNTMIYIILRTLTDSVHHLKGLRDYSRIAYLSIVSLSQTHPGILSQCTSNHFKIYEDVIKSLTVASKEKRENLSHILFTLGFNPNQFQKEFFTHLLPAR